MEATAVQSTEVDTDLSPAQPVEVIRPNWGHVLFVAYGVFSAGHAFGGRPGFVVAGLLGAACSLIRATSVETEASELEESEDDREDGTAESGGESVVYLAERRARRSTQTQVAVDPIDTVNSVAALFKNPDAAFVSSDTPQSTASLFLVASRRPAVHAAIELKAA